MPTMSETRVLTSPLGVYCQPVHDGCWQGVSRSTRTVEAYALAERDAREHDAAHASGAGWFDYLRGWVTA